MSANQKTRLMIAAMDLLKVLDRREVSEGELLTRVASMYYEVGNARRHLLVLSES